MRANDPHYLARSAVEKLIETASSETRLAIVIFDTDIRLAVPLMNVDSVGRSTLLSALDQLDFRGAWTDIPGALERAVYHLRQQGRVDVPHEILFLTDGIIDTGNTDNDRARERWLMDELLPLAAQSDIRIFGIAFSEEADFRLIQTMALRTRADYARALRPDELDGAFQRLYRALQTPRPVVVVEPPPVPVVTPEPLVEPAPLTTPAIEATPAEEREFPWWIWGLVIGAAVGGGTAYAMKKRAVVVAIEVPPGAVLLDLGQASGQKRFEIMTAKAEIGRRPTGAGEGVTPIAINQHTISRHHASISWDGGEYWIEDLQSANGTYVDGERVEGRVMLRDRSRIRLDMFDFEFHILMADATAVRKLDKGDLEDEYTVVRGQPAGTTTEFKTARVQDADAWSEIDDEVIDTVLQEYENPKNN